MFTGIVEEMGTVAGLDERPGLRRLTIAAERTTDGLTTGASIAVNGACLTAVEVAPAQFVVETVPETLRRTNMGMLAVGDRVNLERAMAADGRFGGHLVQGHVDSRVTLASRTPEGESDLLAFATPPEVMRYVVPKGFVAVDGVSLTVVRTDATAFVVALIPHTLAVTGLGTARPGYVANLEVDILAKYVEQLLAVRGPAPPPVVRMEMLRNAGFMSGGPGDG
ncbi:MAG: riboflavin synthase [Actinobacteria bacterium]|nr:riboflavin synthase [Actinomycetota bacterium]